VLTATTAGGWLLVAPGPAQAAPGNAPSEAQAHHELLRLSDLPKGWKATGTRTAPPARASGSGPPATASQLSQVAACEGVSTARIDKAPPSAQAAFARTSRFELVLETVAVFPAQRAARAFFALFSSPKATSCVGPMLGRTLGSGRSQAGVTTSKLTIARLRLRPVGAPASALRLGVPLESHGAEAEIVGDVVVIRSGRSVAVLLPLALSPGPRAAFVHAIAMEAARRLR
jgi:hypothetical protein